MGGRWWCWGSEEGGQRTGVGVWGRARARCCCCSSATTSPRRRQAASAPPRHSATARRRLALARAVREESPRPGDYVYPRSVTRSRQALGRTSCWRPHCQLAAAPRAREPSIAPAGAAPPARDLASRCPHFQPSTPSHPLPDPRCLRNDALQELLPAAAQGASLFRPLAFPARCRPSADTPSAWPVRSRRPRQRTFDELHETTAAEDYDVNFLFPVRELRSDKVIVTPFIVRPRGLHEGRSGAAVLPAGADSLRCSPVAAVLARRGLHGGHASGRRESDLVRPSSLSGSLLCPGRLTRDHPVPPARASTGGRSTRCASFCSTSRCCARRRCVPSCRCLRPSRAPVLTRSFRFQTSILFAVIDTTGGKPTFAGVVNYWLGNRRTLVRPAPPCADHPSCLTTMLTSTPYRPLRASSSAPS